MIEVLVTLANILLLLAIIVFIVYYLKVKRIRNES